MANYLNYNVYKGNITTLLDQINLHISNRLKFKYLSCLNPHSYVISLENKNFQDSLESSSWIVPDGTGIAFSIFLLNRKTVSRITGYDVFTNLSKKLNNLGSFKVFFLGSTNDNLEKIRILYNKEFPNLRIVGMHSPPFKLDYSNEDINTIKNLINECNADVLWVGLTAPKQEMLMYNIKDDLNVSFGAGIGAVFDYYTSKVIHPPQFLRKFYLEWLFRFIQEPFRLFKRNFISTPVFFFIILKQMIRTILR